MLENDQPADEKTVKHIDRCLSCLSCMTTCPSGVHYMHLVDHARAHIENTYKRPWHDRLIRETLAFVLPFPNRFRLSLLAALFAKPFAPIMSRMGGPFARLGAMLSLAPTKVPARGPEPGASFTPEAVPAGRVALLSGCAQPVLNPGINQATIDLLTRKNIEVVLPSGEGCCGALVHHMGKEDKSLADARRNVDVWMREVEGNGLDAIIITASGCGTTIKDYAHMLRLDPAYAEKARTVSGACLRHHRISGAHRPWRANPGLWPDAGLPFSLFDAARPEDHDHAEDVAQGGRVHGQRCAAGSSLLRLGGHLQHHAAADRAPVARQQGRQHREHQSRVDRDRQHWLHDANRHRHGFADHPYGATLELGLWRRRAFASNGRRWPPRRPAAG
jgi:ferredoxin